MPALRSTETANASPPAGDMTWQPGTVIDRYSILRELGQGGMGRVYEAYDRLLNRRLALKVFAQQPLAGQILTAEQVQSAQSELMIEAQAQASLNHRNVVAIYDVGRFAQGVYLAMELITGQTVRAWQRERRRTWREVVGIYLQSARGLAHAHERGIVHRDFKPDNLLIDHEGRVCIADFGLARALHGKARGSSLASLDGETVLAGTPNYMAPEQHLGQIVGPAADHYAFCVSFYEGLYGVRPFIGKNREEVIQACRQQRFTPHGRRRVPRWLHQFVVQGLAFEPGERQVDLQAVVAQLEIGLNSRSAPIFASALATIAAVGTATWLILAPHPEASACHVRAERAQTLWNASTLAELEEKFVGIDAQHGSESAAIMQRVLTSRTVDWSEAYHGTCNVLDRLPWQKPDADRLARTHRQQACLDQQLEEFRAVAQAYAAPDAGKIDAAARIAQTMSHAGTCTDRRSTPAFKAEDPEMVAASLDLQAQIRGLRVNERLQNRQTLQQKIAQLLDRAASLGLADVTAPLLAMSAIINAEELDHATAYRNSQRATLQAILVADDRESADVLAEQVYIQGYKLDFAAEHVSELLHFSQAHLQRAGNDAALAAQACVHFVPFLGTVGHGPQAEACLRAALQTYEREPALYAWDQVKALEYLAVTIGFMRSDPEEISLLLQARDLIIRLAGPHHANLGLTYCNLADAARKLGYLQQSAFYLEQARGLIETSNLPSDVVHAILTAGAHVELQRGHLTRSHAIFRELERRARPSASEVPNGPWLHAQSGLAVIAARRGDFAVCEHTPDLLARLRRVRPSGMYRLFIKAMALHVLTQTAFECGNRELAQAILDYQEHLRLTAGASFNHGTREFTIDPVMLQRLPDAIDDAWQVLNAHIVDRDLQTLALGRPELIFMRQRWAELTLMRGQPADAERWLQHDAAPRIQAVGNDRISTWRFDVLLAWALLDRGQPAAARDLVAPIVDELPEDELELAPAALLFAIYAQACRDLGEPSDQVDALYRRANELYDRLRAPAPAQIILQRERSRR